WNHFQHMFSYWDVLESQGVDWEAALREALTRAALTDDHQDYLTILRHLMAVLKDGHITVYSPFAPAVSLGEAMPRFHWDVIEGEITITTLTPDYDGPLQPGDVITEIDGRPAQTLLAETDALNAAVGQFGIFLALDELITGPLDS